MKLLELFAGVGLFAEDLFVFASLLGSLLLFAWRLANLFASKRHKVPQIVMVWAILGWLLGALCLVGYMASGWTQPLGQIFTRLDAATAGALLVLALVFLGAARQVDCMGNGRRTQKGSHLR